MLVYLIRIASLLNTSVLERIDDVAVDDLRDTMGDDDDGSVFLDSVDAILDLLGGDGVQTGELDEWSSLTALSIMAMIIEEFGVALNAKDVVNVFTIEDLYILVKSKM